MAKKTITIGSRAVDMLSVASANYHYKRIFGEDPFVLQAQAASVEGGAGAQVTFAMQMGFIMKAMADAHGDRAVMAKTDLDEYLDWIDQFSTEDFIRASADIYTLYMAQNRTTSVEKNPEGQSTDSTT